MGNGSLARIVSPDVEFPETHIAYVCRSVLDALAYLHNNQQIHRGSFPVSPFRTRHQERQHPDERRGRGKTGGFRVCGAAEVEGGIGLADRR